MRCRPLADEEALHTLPRRSPSGVRSAGGKARGHLGERWRLARLRPSPDRLLDQLGVITGTVRGHPTRGGLETVDF